MPPSFYVGVFLVVFGLIGALFVYFKYTKEAHKKEMEKNQWAKSDWVITPDINLFVRLGEKSYILAKIVLMLIPLAFAGFGVFLLIATFM
jgi:heme/copper-type cytochrome/quinol oxidase subunit 2